MEIQMNKLKMYFNNFKNFYKKDKYSYNLYIIGMLFIFFGNLEMIVLGFFIIVVSFISMEIFSIILFLMFLTNIYISIKMIHFEKSIIENVQKIYPSIENDHFIFIYQDNNILKIRKKVNLPICKNYYYIKEIHPYKKLFLKYDFVSTNIYCKNPLKE